jgi:hypothetical protein
LKKIYKKAYTISEVAKLWNTDEASVLDLCEQGDLNTYINWVRLEERHRKNVTFAFYDLTDPFNEFTSSVQEFHSMLAKAPIGFVARMREKGKASYRYSELTDTNFLSLGEGWALRIKPVCDNENVKIRGKITILITDLFVVDIDKYLYESNYDIKKALYEPITNKSDSHTKNANMVNSPENDVTNKAELKLIAALLQKVMSSSKCMTQAKLIEELTAQYSEKHVGFSSSIIEKMLARANKALKDSFK